MVGVCHAVPRREAMAEEASLTLPKECSGDAVSPKCAVIEVHVPELKRLFNAMDPSPFRERDLDPKAEEFIAGWAREAPRDQQLALLIQLERGPGLPDEAVELRVAIHEYFADRAQVTRRRLRDLFRRGRVSLVIGLVALTAL